MKKKKVKVEVGYEGGKYSAAATFGDFPGVVIVTRADYPGLQSAVRESVREHIAACVEDGEDVPAYLSAGDYDFEWELSTQALIRAADPYTSMAAIARASGINQRQLSHYANGLKQPRAPQRRRIVEGLHLIGRNLMAIV